MAQKGFFVGLVAGTVLVGVTAVVLTTVPLTSATTTQVRDTLLGELPAPEVQRALPSELLTADCGLTDAVAVALAGSVHHRDRPDAVTDFPTPEARLDAALAATSCARPGTVELDQAQIDELVQIVPRVAGYAVATDKRTAARGWSARLLALGLDLQGAHPDRHGLDGARVAAAGAETMAALLCMEDVKSDRAAESLVLVTTLDASAPEGSWLVAQLASARAKRAMSSNEALALRGSDLTEVSESAFGWWTEVAKAIDAPGAPIPAPPTSEVPDEQALLDVMVPDDIGALVDAQRDASDLRLAASLLAAARVRAEGDALCGPPWQAEPPTDLRTNTAATWDAETCTLFLGARTFRITPPAATTPGGE